MHAARERLRAYGAWLGLMSIATALAADPATHSSVDTNAAGPVSKAVFLGDSITCGVGVGTNATLRYSSRVVAALKEQGKAVAEVNFGRSGNALSQQRASYPAEVLEQQPDLVVVQWGVNDHYWGYSVAQFMVAYEKLIATLRQAKPCLPIVLGTLIADFRYPETSERWIGEANVAIQEVAVKYGCHLADLHRALRHDRAAYYADAIHPNRAGAQAMADEIMRAIGAPALGPSNLRLSAELETGEIRFMQYVFGPVAGGPGFTRAAADTPLRTEVAPRQAEVGPPVGSPGSETRRLRAWDIRPDGMRLEAETMLTVRTAPIYPAGTYRIDIMDAAGAGVTPRQAAITWERTLTFDVDPAGHAQPMRISIRREETGRPEAGIVRPRRP